MIAGRYLSRLNPLTSASADLPGAEREGGVRSGVLPLTRIAREQFWRAARLRISQMARLAHRPRAIESRGQRDAFSEIRDLADCDFIPDRLRRRAGRYAGGLRARLSLPTENSGWTNTPLRLVAHLQEMGTSHIFALFRSLEALFVVATSLTAHPATTWIPRPIH